MLTQIETRERLDKIAIDLMQIANSSQGNSREFEFALEAAIILQKERETR